MMRGCDPVVALIGGAGRSRDEVIMSAAEPGTLYDEFPYPTQAFEQTHPDRLATMAALMGLEAPQVATCRVLELGCAQGGNLLPMAAALPEARFEGVDLSPVQIQIAAQQAQELGLRNVRFRALDLRDLGADEGSFDYILAHGLYSWVPPEVQQAILELCQRLLSPSGVAYVSYNALPGCHFRQMVREMARYHVREARSVHQQIAGARELLSMLAEGTSRRDHYPALLKDEARRMAVRGDANVLHDDLATFNEPLYFHQFIERAGRHGLQFLAEAEYSDMQQSAFAPPVQRSLLQIGDVLVREQYRDFLRNRRFRQTLLCRAEVALDRAADAGRARRFLVDSQARPVSAAPKVRGNKPEEFRHPSGNSLGTASPVGKAALLHLCEQAPRALTFAEVLAGARERLGARPDEAQDEDTLAEHLHAAWGAGLLTMHTHAPQIAVTPGERPVASPVARLQVQSGSTVTSLWHRGILLDDALARRLLPLLDGRHDRAGLKLHLLQRLQAGGPELARELLGGAGASKDRGKGSGAGKGPDRGPGAAKDSLGLPRLIDERLEPTLQKFADYALLLA